ncbi:MAG TPA: glycosyltransferase family 39 protein [Solirubrobacteraceae bacterium]|nr:glycosyltransferase family 39 protein [Solirubrobacteraceae bacterium]
MSVAETAAGGPPGARRDAAPGDDPEAPPRLGAPRRPFWLGLAVVLAAALALRLWGIGHGLPYAYNADENAHFVPGAIGLFGHGYNPHYFVNPPAYTYLLHAVFAAWFGGREGVSSAYATHPTEVFVVARVTAAVVGTLAVWLLYCAGAKLAGRRVGLLAAALLALGFLPVFYSHLALNDVPTLAPIALSLWGTAGVLHDGRLRWYALAGVGLGLACATKYTGGIVLAPLLAAAALQFARPQAGARPATALGGLALAGVLSLGAFVAANPFAVLDFQAFRDGLSHQQSAAEDELGKLGLTQESGHLYYVWTFTWGLGYVPFGAAVLGALGMLLRDRRLALVLIPAPLLYVLFMGAQERFFGRWLLPAFPIVCLIAAWAIVRAAELAGRRAPALRPALHALGAVLLLGQGFVYSLHDGLVLSKPDTRNLARAWMVANVPPETKIVVEPVVPDAWASDIGRPYPGTSNGARWIKFPTSRSNIANDGSVVPGEGRIVNIEDFERTLVPALVERYEREGWCYVVSGSTQRGRAEADPAEVPRALAYYRELERRSDLVFRASPYLPGAAPVEFNFDWSFDYYPLSYARPGPDMRIYRLKGGVCSGKPSGA